jgi:6-pyruvoyltetrahydropterin/6-carboxytetrahydropterin synthase
MYEISKKFRFEASHRLIDTPKCERLHGHSYVVTLHLAAAVLKSGMVRDYNELAFVKQFIDAELDHKYLVSKELIRNNDIYYRAAINDPDRSGDVYILDLERSTAESLAQLLFNAFQLEYPELVAVTVCETESTTATYRPERKSNPNDNFGSAH